MGIYQILILLIISVVLQIAQAGGKTVYKKEVFAPGDGSKQSIHTPAKSDKPKVEIYYAAWDPYSHKALRFFRDHHIVVETYDIGLDDEAAARKKKLAPDFNGIPLVVINGIVIRGIDEKKYKDALWPIKPPR